ncbi:hypothetical protein BV22DRAFT_566534 [Leucogyrophana mollusca]|uniref:Uncharacterized protein n=1 Tax=Leucogyrophana mollusca TaxID=85980 RepID=A0ACB8BEL2_9AGAM|nr:hypothetical protein BV22DRAFT_566534 [Leucogyrophana mollusca]
MSTSPSEGLKTSENSSEPVFGNTNDDASARLVGLGAQSSSNNRHARDNFSPKAIDAGRTNGEASPRPVVPDFTRDNDPPTSTGTDILTESVELLKKIHQTLKDSTIAQESGTDDMSRFWATYKRHAEEYDSEFFDKYKDDMDIVLIFAGLFSAVSTAFLTAMQSSLSADPTDTTNALLMQVVHALNNSTFAGQNLEPPAWNGPGPTMTWVQSLIYASLSASLLAALGAVLGKQWLGQYRQKGLGMNDERGRRRQKKLDGLKTWHFHIVLEALPVLLQISLLLFSVALSAYVWTRQPTIGAVVISTTSLGVLFYVSITATAVISPNCPFQTPLSIALPVLWCFAHHIGKTALTATAKTMRRTQLRQNILVAWLDARQEPHRVGISKMYHRVSNWLDDRWRKVSRGRVRVSTDPESLRLSGLVSSPPPGSPLKLDIPPHRSVQDAPSVKWLLETSTDPDVITVAARNVPEVEWPAELNLSAAVAQLRNIFEGCFVYNNDLKTWQLAPSGRERALACGIALVYLDCEKSSTERWEAGDPFHRLTSSQLHEMFAVLRSENEECKCVSQVFFIQRLIMGDWRSYAGTPRVSPSGLQGGWWFHLLPHLLSTPRCPDNIKSEAAKQIAKQLSFTNLPSPSILADCLLSAAILVGVPIDREVFVKFGDRVAPGIAPAAPTNCSRSRSGRVLPPSAVPL